MKSRQRELERASLMLERNASKFPQGKIHIVKNKNRIQYYIRYDTKDKSGIYLSKKADKKIGLYLQKKYEAKTAKLINAELRILEKAMTGLDGLQEKIRKVYSDYPEVIKQYITPLDISDEDYVRAWEKTDYDTKGVDSGVAAFVTDKGEHVRSKSELNIANSLNKKGIPYRYECPYTLSTGRTIYPDFTVLDVKNRRELLWEHRGMMDDREYSKHSVRRIREYGREGLYAGDGLIITEETSTQPLGTDEIEKIIDHYFLQ